jgi:hypothetical protein
MSYPYIKETFLTIMKEVEMGRGCTTNEVEDEYL